MKRIKLLFHHDLPLEPTEASPENLLALFGTPQQTYSRLWLSASDTDSGSAALSQATFVTDILSAVEAGLRIQSDVLFRLLSEPILLQKTGLREIEMVTYDMTLHPETISHANRNTLFVYRVPGKDGFDLEFLSKSNVHSVIFNTLAPLVSEHLEMWSINGKRVLNPSQLYLEFTKATKMPHGFEIVQSHFRL